MGLDNGTWISTTDGAYAVYNDDPANADIYGNLYNWYAVNDSRGICPEAFHVPSNETLLLSLLLSPSELSSSQPMKNSSGNNIIKYFFMLSPFR